jgi:two-component system, OmpR family, response regulator CpxR
MPAATRARRTDDMVDAQAIPHRCSVLVVDDDPAVRELLLVALTEEGYDVATVSNGREALHHLRSHAETCVIIMELVLPVMDGRAFRIAQLRDRSLAWIPVVMMSAASDADQRAQDLGARIFVRKPLNLDDVRHALRRIGCCQTRPRGVAPALTTTRGA